MVLWLLAAPLPGRDGQPHHSASLPLLPLSAAHPAVYKGQRKMAVITANYTSMVAMNDVIQDVFGVHKKEMEQRIVIFGCKDTLSLKLCPTVRQVDYVKVAQGLLRLVKQSPCFAPSW